jgi:hypothetical protein
MSEYERDIHFVEVKRAQKRAVTIIFVLAIGGIVGCRELLSTHITLHGNYYDYKLL